MFKWDSNRQLLPVKRGSVSGGDMPAIWNWKWAPVFQTCFRPSLLMLVHLGPLCVQGWETTQTDIFSLSWRIIVWYCIKWCIDTDLLMYDLPLDFGNLWHIIYKAQFYMRKSGICCVQQNAYFVISALNGEVCSTGNQEPVCKYKIYACCINNECLSKQFVHCSIKRM